MSVIIEHQVTIKVSADTPFRVKDKVKLLNTFSNIPMEDQERILAICNNPKALEKLAENWDFLQSLFS